MWNWHISMWIRTLIVWFKRPNRWWRKTLKAAIGRKRWNDCGCHRWTNTKAHGRHSRWAFSRVHSLSCWSPLSWRPFFIRTKIGKLRCKCFAVHCSSLSFCFCGDWMCMGGDRPVWIMCSYSKSIHEIICPNSISWNSVQYLVSFGPHVS